VSAAAIVGPGEARGGRQAGPSDVLTFWCTGHGEAVHAVGDDSQAGGDQECRSVGLGPKCFESPVEFGGRVRLRPTRCDHDQHSGSGDN
jgi:hypothetical protein